MMSLANLLSYFLVLVAIALAPGPAALLILVRAANGDVRSSIGVSIGYSLGGLFIAAIAYIGIESWLSAYPAVFDYGKFVLLIYLLWMAYKILDNHIKVENTQKRKKHQLAVSILMGLETCLISPYMMILFPLLLPELIDFQSFSSFQFSVATGATFAGLMIGCISIVAFAAQINRLVQSPHATMVLTDALPDF